MKKKPVVYCFVPGCWNKPVKGVLYGAGRCTEHRYVSQDRVQGTGAVPISPHQMRAGNRNYAYKEITAIGFRDDNLAYRESSEDPPV